MSRPRAGSLFTGTAALDRAAAEVLGTELAWVSDIDPGARALLAHHYPDVPNLGDITRIDWSVVEPVDVLTGGFPCQPVSLAGKRKGGNDARWLWDEFAKAIRIIRPRYVLIENVPGLLTAPGRQPDCVCGWNRRWGGLLGDLLDDHEWTNQVLADAGGPDDETACAERVVRDLWGAPRGGQTNFAESRGDVEVGAVWSDASVPTEASPAVVDREARPGRRGSGDALAGVAAVGEQARHSLDARGVRRMGGGEDADSVLELQGFSWPGGDVCPACGRPVDDAENGSVRRAMGEVLGSLSSLGFDAIWCVVPASAVGAPHRRERLFLAAEDTHRAARGERWRAAPGQTQGRWARADAGGRGGTPAANPESDGRHEGRPEPARIERGSDDAVGGAPTWGDYWPAIHRWERTLGRVAPEPTVPGARGNRTLNPALCEWLMGLPEGWITAVPGLSRNAQLKLAGNGVVPQQAIAAFNHLLPCLSIRSAA